jgi:hypothetical protein
LGDSRSRREQGAENPEQPAWSHGFPGAGG